MFQIFKLKLLNFENLGSIFLDDFLGPKIFETQSLVFKGPKQYLVQQFYLGGPCERIEKSVNFSKRQFQNAWEWSHFSRSKHWQILGVWARNFPKFCFEWEKWEKWDFLNRNRNRNNFYRALYINDIEINITCSLYCSEG